MGCSVNVSLDIIVKIILLTQEEMIKELFLEHTFEFILCCQCAVVVVGCSTLHQYDHVGIQYASETGPMLTRFFSKSV